MLKSQGKLLGKVQQQLLRNKKCHKSALALHQNQKRQFFDLSATTKPRACAVVFSEGERESRYLSVVARKMGFQTDANTKFNLKNYDVVGFDLDGTLLRYNLPEMVPLEYRCLVNSLVRKGYPEEYLQKSIDPDFLQKGLILHAAKGNILKLNQKGEILKAMHGTRPLSEQEIIKEYGNERTWSISSEFIRDPLSTWNGPASEQMRTLLDYFDMPASLVLARAVDAIDSKNGKVKGSIGTTGYTIWPDILDALYEMYKRDHFKASCSEYFEALKAEPQRYILKTNPDVVKWLKELKASGKAVYLLTGSNVDFANLTASFALGENWRELFDSVVCFARKPGFFVEQRPFFSVDGLDEVEELPLQYPLQLDTVYSQGNWTDLKYLLAKKVGKEADALRCIYVGDNLIQDVYTPSCIENMDSIAVSEEMFVADSVMSPQVPNNYRKILESSLWNSYFGSAEQPTLWTKIIHTRAKLCVPTVDYLVQNDLNKDFHCENVFYPSYPMSK